MMRFSMAVIAAVMTFGAASIVPARAVVIYDLTFSGATLRDYNGDDLGETFDGGFSLSTASPINAAASLSPTTCSLSANAAALYSCAATQDFDPDGFGTGQSYIGFNTVNNDNSGGGTGFLFFDAGVFLADGIYSIFTGTITDGTNFYGNFASVGTLTVSGIVTEIPEPGSLALLTTALVGFGAFHRRRRR